MVDKQCDDLRLDLRIVYDRPKAALLPPMPRMEFRPPGGVSPTVTVSPVSSNDDRSNRSLD